MNKLLSTTMAVFLFGLCLTRGQTERELGALLDEWHLAAARADFEGYVGKMTKDAVFIGTDATEYWLGQAFRDFSKPYFEQGKAWSFHSVERHVYLNEREDLAWFDELLDTRMGLCRGSGVMQKNPGGWKIAHYVLSIAVPNKDVDALLDLKKESDSLLLLKLKQPR